LERARALTRLDIFQATSDSRDPTAETFDVALYEAEARADELAVTLNAGDQA
jgi:hypothetical protein